jgi:soluble lytic murein transglycosylase-like protein
MPRMKPKILLKYLFFILLGQPFSSFGQIENDLCWEEAGRRYSVDPLLLYSIAQVESNLQPNAFNDNGDTQDYGIMQINSWWIEQLAEYDIDKDKLYEPCVNINIGAWILNHSFGIYGHSWDAVGAYNAGTGDSPETVALRARYANKVYKQYSENRGKYKDSVGFDVTKEKDSES